MASGLELASSPSVEKLLCSPWPGVFDNELETHRYKQFCQQSHRKLVSQKDRVLHIAELHRSIRQADRAGPSREPVQKTRNLARLKETDTSTAG